MAQLNYTVNDKELEESFEVIPAGTYLAIIEGSDFKENKQGTGRILSLKYQIIEGPMKGRKLFENLNLENKSTQAETIARKALNSIGVATGVLKIKDSALLHDIPFHIEVKIKNDDKYGMRNEIGKHTAKDSNGTTTPSKVGANTGTTDNMGSSPAKKKMAWEK